MKGVNLMHNHIGPVLAAVGIAGIIIAAALSDGGTSLRAASLMGLAGLAVLVSGVIYADRVDDAARRAEQTAAALENTIRRNRRYIREKLRHAT